MSIEEKTVRATVYHNAALEMQPTIDRQVKLVDELRAVSLTHVEACEQLVAMQARNVLLELRALQQELRQVAQSLGGC